MKHDWKWADNQKVERESRAVVGRSQFQNSQAVLKQLEEQEKKKKN